MQNQNNDWDEVTLMYLCHTIGILKVINTDSYIISMF